MTAVVPPLVVHVVYRLSVGGLENGVVNLINRMPADRWRHAVVALTQVDPAFAARIIRPDVALIELGKRPGHAFHLYPSLLRLFRTLRPSIVHTRNLGALEASVPAWAARVPVRVHGEHGWDVEDIDGTNRTYRFVRRAHRVFISHYIALSGGIERYLADAVRVPRERMTRIVNGVDLARFTPASTRARPPGCPFDDPRHFVIGSVGRLEAVKNHALLARAFVRALELAPWLRHGARLAIVGDGAQRARILGILDSAGVAPLAWLPGMRDDIPDILRAFDLFVLPSLAEGISNTILEAMASGLPVVATRVGGNVELVESGRSGDLVPSDDVEALATALVRYADFDTARAAGRAGRERAVSLYGLDSMVAAHCSLYERLLAARNGKPARIPQPPAPRQLTSGGP
jgi:sugar transferase (PEP-CTERM/EpsH1 system associated)